MTETRTTILNAISDWLKLLALVVLVAEASILVAMKLTPEASPIRSHYPIYMLMFLVIIVGGIFFDRYLTYKNNQELNKGTTNKDTITESKTKGDLHYLEGWWADTFLHKNDIRSALFNIRRTDNGWLIRGQEFAIKDTGIKEVLTWTSDTAKFNENKQRLEYLYTSNSYEATSTYGYSVLNFTKSRGTDPMDYHGYFVDIFDSKEPPRTSELEGIRVDEQQRCESLISRRELARELIEKPKTKSFQRTGSQI